MHEPSLQVYPPQLVTTEREKQACQYYIDITFQRRHGILPLYESVFCLLFSLLSFLIDMRDIGCMSYPDTCLKVNNENPHSISAMEAGWNTEYQRWST